LDENKTAWRSFSCLQTLSCSPFFVSAALPPLIQFAPGAAARSQLQKLVIVAATFKPLYLSLLPEGCPARAPHFINKLSEKYL